MYKALLSQLFKAWRHHLFGSLIWNLEPYDYCFAKLMTGSVDAGTITVVRNVMISLFSAVVSLINRKTVWDRTRSEIIVTITCGVLTAQINIALFYSSQLISIATVMLLFSTSPLFLILINAVVLRIWSTVLKVFTLVLCLVSMVLCMQPDFIFNPGQETSSLENLGMILSMSASLGCALYVILFHKINDTDFIGFLVSSSLVTAVVSIIFIKITGTFQFSNTGIDYCFLLANGVCSFAASFLFLIACIYVGALLATLGRSIDVAFGIFSAL